MGYEMLKDLEGMVWRLRKILRCILQVFPLRLILTLREVLTSGSSPDVVRI